MLYILNHKSDAKLRKATKCGVADHVTRFPYPDDPQLDFLTITEVEAGREKRDLIVRENSCLCNLGTIFYRNELQERLEFCAQLQLLIICVCVCVCVCACVCVCVIKAPTNCVCACVCVCIHTRVCLCA